MDGGMKNIAKGQVLRLDSLVSYQEGQVVSAAEDLPKAFVLTSEYGLPRVYLTQFNAATLEKRLAALARRSDRRFG